MRKTPKPYFKQLLYRRLIMNHADKTPENILTTRGRILFLSRGSPFSEARDVHENNASVRAVASRDGGGERRRRDSRRNRLVNPTRTPSSSPRSSSAADRGISRKYLYGDQSDRSRGRLAPTRWALGTPAAPADSDLVGVVGDEAHIDACIATRYSI